MLRTRLLIRSGFFLLGVLSQKSAVIFRVSGALLNAMEL